MEWTCAKCFKTRFETVTNRVLISDPKAKVKLYLTYTYIYVTTSTDKILVDRDLTKDEYLAISRYLRLNPCC